MVGVFENLLLDNSLSPIEKAERIPGILDKVFQIK